MKTYTRPIGQQFLHLTPAGERVRLEVVEQKDTQNPCKGCYLNGPSMYCMRAYHDIGLCNQSARADNKSVIFRQV